MAFLVATAMYLVNGRMKSATVIMELSLKTHMFQGMTLQLSPNKVDLLNLCS